MFKSGNFVAIHSTWVSMALDGLSIAIQAAEKHAIVDRNTALTPQYPQWRRHLVRLFAYVHHIGFHLAPYQVLSTDP